MHGVLLTETTTGTPLSQWAGVCAGLLVLIYLSFIRPLQKKRQKDPLAQQPAKSSLAQQRAVERDMSALLVEYEQMIRQMTSQIETRVTKLEMLLEEADRKLAELRKESSQSRPVRGLGESVEPQTIETRSIQKPVRDLPAPAREPQDFEDPSDTPAAPDIYQLADQGLSVGEIARRSGRMFGEVELILALRSQGDGSQNAVRPDDASASLLEPRRGGAYPGAVDPSESGRDDRQEAEPDVAESFDTSSSSHDQAMAAATAIARQLASHSQSRGPAPSSKQRKKHRR